MRDLEDTFTQRYVVRGKTVIVPCVEDEKRTG